MIGCGQTFQPGQSVVFVSDENACVFSPDNKTIVSVGSRGEVIADNGGNLVRVKGRTADFALAEDRERPGETYIDWFSRSDLRPAP
jgi:hypothetical protein